MPSRLIQQESCEKVYRLSLTKNAHTMRIHMIFTRRVSHLTFRWLPTCTLYPVVAVAVVVAVVVVVVGVVVVAEQ